MTSAISSGQNQPTAASTANAASTSASGTSSPLTAVPAQLPSRSYASATKTFSQAANSTASGPSLTGPGAPVQHGKESPVNGKTMQNGEHGRKPSVIISASGTTGQIPNGGPVGQSSRPNISFGSINASHASPAIASSVPHQAATPSLTPGNPRITSPTHSPSPIPQPAASGGKPPSNLPSGPSNGLSFGSMGAENGDASNRGPMSQTPLTPSAQPVHLRRESSQSAHSDMSNAGMQRGFAPPNGRGRGGYMGGQGFVPHSPAQNYRQPPNQQRGGPNMAPQFQGQGQMGQSPYRGSRSPAMMHAQPFMPQGMQNPQMQYGVHPQQHLNPQQQVNTTPSPSLPAQNSNPLSSPLQKKGTPAQQSHVSPSSVHMPEFSRDSPAFEHYLTYVNSQQAFYGGQPPYDPSNGYYQAYYPQQQQSYYPAPPSPRPGQNYPAPYGGPPSQYMQSPQHPMSRSASQISERPGSSVGQPAASAPSNVSQGSHTPAPSTPAPSTSSFQIPQKTKSKAIVIKNDKGEEVTFGKKPSPAPAAIPQSPAIVSSSAPTPPPRTPSVQHNRAESKTAAETKNEFQEQVKRKLEAEREAEKAKEDAESKAVKDKQDADAKIVKDKEEADAKAVKDKQDADAKAVKDKQEADAKIAKDKQEADAKAAKDKEEADAKALKEKTDKEEAEAASKKAAAEEAEKAEKAQKAEKDAAEKAATEKAATEKAATEKAAADTKAQEEADKAKAEPVESEEDKKAREKREEDERIEAEIAEMEEQERLEEERERAYQEKKNKQKAEQAVKDKEAAAKADEEMKRMEREAEELEQKREQERENPVEKSAEEQTEAEKLFASLKKPTLGPGANEEAETPAPEESAASKSAAKPKPAALKLETSKPVEPAQPTAGMQALKSARFLEVKNDSINYPSGIKSPNPALNQDSKRIGKEYDMEFLLQFQDIFQEKPTVDWDQRVKDTLGDGEPGSARPAGGRGGSSMGGRAPSGRGSAGAAPAFGAMGSFGNTRTLPPGTSSQDRFNASNAQRGGGMANPMPAYAGRPSGFPVGGPGAMSRGPSMQGGMGSPKVGGSSRRGGGGGSKRGPSHRNDREEADRAKNMPLTAGMELKGLEKSTTGWKPTSIGAPVQQPDPSGHMAPDMVQRKVKAALNKMTPENFEKISDQIMTIANQSKNEKDGRTLRQVIQLTFEKACDEAHWAGTYAKFCSKMLTSMSNEIADETIRDRNNNPVVGGGLFRKYLLNRCQEEFERGWEANLPDKPEGSSQEAALLSDEYYIMAAAKRRGLGLIQFIGELYKLGMLTVKIMHQCVLRLLNFEGQPDESAVENLSKLLKAVGSTMDNSEQGHQLVNIYYDRLQNIMDNHKDMPSRSRFMLMDIIDLRKGGWKSKDADKGPKTIEQIHAEAEAAQAAAELERSKNTGRGGHGGNRMPMGRGDARSFSGGGMPPPDYPRNQVGMDDLRRLQNRGVSGRQASQGLGPNLGPSSLFNSSRSNSGRKGLGPPRDGETSGPSSRSATPSLQQKKEEPSTHANAFSALALLDGEGAEGVGGTSEAGSPPTSKAQPASIDETAAPSSTDNA